MADEVEGVEEKGSRELHRERYDAARRRIPSGGSRKQRTSALGYDMRPLSGAGFAEADHFSGSNQ